MSEQRAPYNPHEHMMSLRGKDYLPVAARIIWCRNDHPDAIMRTTLVEWDRDAGFCLYRAEVTLPTGGHAEATATQTAKDFPQYLEKCESKALGRALGFLGYGTLAAEEEDPANPNIVDSPVERPARPPQPRSTPRQTPQEPPNAPAPPDTTLTDEQERVIAQARDMAEAGDTYPAVIALLKTLQVGASPAQWTEIRRALASIKAEHYAQEEAR